MSRTYNSIWIHAIWSTKNRKWLLTKPFRYKLFKHIKEEGARKNYYIDIINGVEDHVHCLFGLKPTQNISQIVKDIKGESSRWINTNGFTEEPFNWQEGYGALSVSPSMVEKVRYYIYNQEEHHKQRNYESELNVLEKQFNTSIDIHPSELDVLR